MSDCEKETILVAYCGIYCRLCDYFTGRIRDSARDLLTVPKKHTELKLFGETTKAFDYDRFLESLKWLLKEMTPCVSGCKGGGVGKTAHLESVVGRKN